MGYYLVQQYKIQYWDVHRYKVKHQNIATLKIITRKKKHDK